MVEQFEQFERPKIKGYFSRLCLPGEMVLPTLLMHLQLNKGPMNHCFQHHVQPHPRLFEEEGSERLKVSHAFIGRKFANDPAAAVRTRVLGERVGA